MHMRPYYRFSDDSGDVFDSYKAAESEAHGRMLDAGSQQIKPYLAHAEDELEELCATFGLDYDDYVKIENADAILEVLKAQA